MATQGLQWVSASCRNWTGFVSDMSTRLKHQATNFHFNMSKSKLADLHLYSHYFSSFTCCILIFQIVQVEYWGQTRCTEILECKNLIDTYYSRRHRVIDWSWNILSVHIFCSMLIRQVIDLRKAKTKNLWYRTNLWEEVVAGGSISHKMMLFRSESEADC